MPPREWDAATYDRTSAPQELWGREVVNRLDLQGDERVLDAGCGTGRVTAVLADLVPRGEVVAVDGSEAMVAQTRQRLGGRVETFACDLLELELDRPVDAILSTATFHWIADHDALFARLHAALRPGGKLVAQCGGAGNIASVHAAARQAAEDPPFRAHFEGWRGPWNFATPEDTERRLRAAGFGEARCWLAERPVQPDDPRAYLREINLGAHLERLPADLHEPYLDAVLARLGERPTIDYVRLNIDAAAA
jgi:trans-aconitate 2-methyltransferase